MSTTKRLFLLLAILMLGILTACDSSSVTPAVTNNGVTRPNNAIDVSIIYAPESALYLPKAIEDFNRAFASGKNPVTGQNLASGERPIFVTDLTGGKGGSSGTVMQGIVNAIIAPNNANVAKPVIYSPSVSHWLALANYQSGRQLFDLADVQPTALAPVVMAIWESRLDAIRAKAGTDEIGWQELLDVLRSPNGWQDYGFSGRKTVYYGHTDPFISSTALSTLIAEFYASSRSNGFTGRRLGLEQVNEEAVQQGVRDIEQLIRHYSSRTTEFREYIAQGPEYLDFVALEENDLIYINQGKTNIQPPEKLVALYPKEGTFWHEHPFGIVNGDWVTQEQKDAARVFTQYILSADVQRVIMEQGFRPANPDVELGFPFVEENGVSPAGPATVLDVPAPDVVSAIQQSWSFVKKQADIMLLIDVSGSMESEDKIGQAKQAAEAFINNMEPTNRIGLAIFSSDFEIRIPLNNTETVQQQIISNIRGLRAEGGTELFDALRQTVDYMNEQTDTERIRAVVLLSDGADTGDQGVTLNDALRAISASRETLNPVIVVPVAYGADADINALSSIARSSNTRVQSGDPQNILSVLEIISSYF
jgi:Ca-activated chloride channel homolog